MDIFLEKLGGLGRMRIMAFPAIDHIRINADMGAGKRLRFQFVAFAADFLHRLIEQGRLGREMRLVTGQAIVLGWWMGLFLAHFFLEFLVTGQAEIRLHRQRQFVQSGFVRAVALGALIGKYRRVFAFEAAGGPSQAVMAGNA